ncbi:hypothetical protein RKI04_24875 [Citrobacter amalonaticus]|uniref:hypothetical protein n=1 Tax=Citrobacter amalonaticus TaxID=35703 RepID=UPI0028785EBB|nr:hypothetical protein [Citrobacter amalonaticus]MDS4039459.1 hypothetical protein [Citrobacter amalonaticus]
MHNHLTEKFTDSVQSEGSNVVNKTPLMYCYGCDRKCTINTPGQNRTQECNGFEFYIWPNNNSFLVEGILPYFLELSEKLILQPVVIIDFNHKNIRYFLSGEWLQSFKGMRLILVADKKMAAIAHYWFYNDTTETIISSVIFHDDKKDDIIQKIKDSFLGKVTRPSESKPRLSANEYALFSSLYRGELPKKIAQKNETSVKNIYAMKIRIEHKLGISISRLVG